MIRAAPTDRYCRTLEPFLVIVLPPGLASCPPAGRWSHADTWASDGHQCAAYARVGPGKAFPNASSCAQPSGLVDFGASRILLCLLVSTFSPDGPVVLGIDETIERRRGAKIGAAGIYRDPVRSSHSHFVKVNRMSYNPSWRQPANTPRKRFSRLRDVMIQLPRLVRPGGASRGACL
jgi:hypothetical protein